MTGKFIASAVLAALGFIASASFAEIPSEAKPLGKFGAWEAAYFLDNGEKVCYMAARPKKDGTVSDKPVKGRGEAYLFITHWPDDDKNAVTISAGFTLKTGSKATVTVDGKAFTLMTGGKEKAAAEADAQMAWMNDAKEEDALAAAISKGTKLSVKMVSQRGNNITDTYSLDGSGDAYQAINKECGQ